MTDPSTTLSKISTALLAANRALTPYLSAKIEAKEKEGGRGPVTEADLASNQVLRLALPGDGEGWLSEETVDDFSRLDHGLVWIVDPLDGTSEFVAGIPEWCVSVALVEDGRPIAGGISNPATGEVFLGARGAGLTYNDNPALASQRGGLQGAAVLASRSELRRGEWKQFEGAGFEIRPTGSVAYKLALVAAGRADATWTLKSKNEWDVAAGVALIEAGGGVVRTTGNQPLGFNKKSTLIPGLFACGPNLAAEIAALLARTSNKPSK